MLDFLLPSALGAQGRRDLPFATFNEVSDR
jgi:hypothetical protein